MTWHGSMGGKYDLPWEYGRKILLAIVVREENMTCYSSVGGKLAIRLWEENMTCHGSMGGKYVLP